MDDDIYGNKDADCDGHQIFDKLWPVFVGFLKHFPCRFLGFFWCFNPRISFREHRNWKITISRKKTSGVAQILQTPGPAVPWPMRPCAALGGCWWVAAWSSGWGSSPKSPRNALEIPWRWWSVFNHRWMMVGYFYGGYEFINNFLGFIWWGFMGVSKIWELSLVPSGKLT